MVLRLNPSVVTETIFSPEGQEFGSAVKYGSVRGQFGDFYLKDRSPQLRAFVARVAVSSQETLIELTNGGSLRAAEIERVSVYFDEHGGPESISCLCQ